MKQTLLTVITLLSMISFVNAAEKPLKGKINNVEWTIVSGRARPHMFRPGYYSFNFWDHQESKPCDSFTWGSERQILASFPAKVGKHPLNNNQNVTFNYNQNQNDVSFKGTFVITKITETTVEGSLTTKMNAKNFVAGNFVVELCAE